MRPILCALCVLAIAVEPAHAQLAETQVGVVGGYSNGHAYGPGAGLTVGVAPGRLVYVGLRWMYYFGVPEHRGVAATEVRTKTQVITVDLGVQIPAGTLEVIPDISLGWNQFTQRASQPSASGYSKEFFAAPGVAVELRVARLGLIPEIQYIFAGSPELPWRVEHRGLLFSVRCVYLGELKRIRR